MSRDRLECFVNAIKTLIRKSEKPSCPDPLCAHRFPQTEAQWFVRGANRYLGGEDFESALELNRRGRPVNSYKPENLELAKNARRLRKQGMTWDDVTQELFMHRRDPPSTRYVQILVKRFTPVIEEEECKAMIDEYRQRRKGRPGRAPTPRSKTPSRRASTPGRNEIEAIWVDPTLKLTPKTLMKMFRRQARNHRNPK